MAAQRGPKVGSRPPGFKPVSPADCLVVTLLPTYYHTLYIRYIVPIVGYLEYRAAPAPYLVVTLQTAHCHLLTATCHTDIYADKNQTKLNQTDFP